VGRTVAALRGDNRALAWAWPWRGGHLDASTGELAACSEAISTGVNRPDLWSGFLSPPLAEEALHTGRSSARPAPRVLLRQQEKASGCGAGLVGTELMVWSMPGPPHQLERPDRQ